MTSPRTLLLVLASTAAAVGCGGSQMQTHTDGDTTYWQDVAPIYDAKCVRCHQDGGIAPFRLDRYGEAKANAAAELAAVQGGIMPPYAMVHDGSCGSFHDERTLTADEKAVIQRWVQGGGLEGTPVSLPPPDQPTLEGAVDVSTPVFSPVAQGGELAEFDEYRCFLMDPPATAAGAFLTGYDVTPGDAAIVHHVIVYVVDPQAPGQGAASAGKTNAAIMQGLDAASPDRLGWPCFGSAGDGVNVSGAPVTWAPGQGIVAYPPGMGAPISATDKLVVQVHYNLADIPAGSAPRTDQTKIHLRFAPTVDRQVVFLLPDLFLGSLDSATPDSLPPRQADTAYTWKVTGSDLGIDGTAIPSVDLVAVMPHMHGRGIRQQLRIGAGDPPACAAHLENWNFHWQQFYFYDQPITITAGSKVQLTCEYDTSRDTLPVMPGWGTKNEMCLAVMMVALPAP